MVSWVSACTVEAPAPVQDPFKAVEDLRNNTASNAALGYNKKPLHQV